MPSYTQYLRQMAALDANDDDIESWITVKGNHIPIRKGQSKEDAVKSFIEKKGGKYKQESYGKHYVKTGEKGDEKYVDPRTDTLHREKSKVGFFGSEKEAKEYAYKLNHTDPYAGTPFAVKNYKRTKFPYNVESEEKESKYDPEFEVVRKNALANGNVYGGKYTQKSKAEAYKEYKKDTSSKENAQKANAFVNSEHVDKPKNTFLSNPNTLKEFANHFGISESAAKNAAEKYGDEFYNTMVKDPMKGVGMAVGGEKKSGGYTIPEDYKASVKNYTKEKHEQAANFYGEKMATAQKRANRENDPNVNIFRNQFNEYQALSHWHAEQAKANTEPKKKSESKKQPADIMDWKFEDVMKLPSSDPRVHKYIAKNTGVKQEIVAQVAEALPNTEDLYFRLYNMSDVEKDALLGNHLLQKYPETFGTDY